jgi:D-arginine dehydrogenase
MDADVIIIGAGIAGAALAAALAPHARVIILEAEDAAGRHATGRSAAVFGRSYGNAVIRELSRLSAPVFESPPESFVAAPLYRPRPWLMVARDDQRAALDRWFAANPALVRLDADAVRGHAPLLRPGYAAGGALDAGCGDLDVDALLQACLRRARQHRCTLHVDAPVTAIAPVAGGWQISAGGDSHRGSVLVNAAGAWADAVAGLAGLSGIGLQVLRRTAVLVDPLAGCVTADLPLVFDVDERFYFKPDAGKIMISPADETPQEPGDAQADEYDVAVAIDCYQQATGAEVRRVSHRWAGLRTFAPDRTPVAGFDARAPGFYWLAGQGGYGVQTAPALADFAAGQIRGTAVEPAFAAALAPGRFRL